MRDHVIKTYDEKLRKELDQMDIRTAALWARSLVKTYPNLISKEMIESLDQIETLNVVEARKEAFKMHAYARKETNQIVQLMYRASGHALATLHVKEHALRCYDYISKIKKMKGDLS